MVSLVDNTSGTIYPFPVVTQLQYNNTVEVTQMPLPLQPNPILLNFGGADPSISVQFMITDTANVTGTAQGDWALLTGQVAGTFQFASSIHGYRLIMPEVSPSTETPISVNGYVYTLQLTYIGGTSNTYQGQMVFYPGGIIII